MRSEALTYDDWAGTKASYFMERRPGALLQHPRQTLSTMARAFRSALRLFSERDGARAPACSLRRDLASAASVRARRPRAARLRRGVWATRFCEFRGRVRAFGEEVLGAKVEGVALG